MNEEQKGWVYQFSRNLGAREFLRFGAVFFIWIFLGTVISVLVEKSVILVSFLVFFFTWPFIIHRWRPAYMLFRRIMNNPAIPTEPYPWAKFASEKKPWYYYLPSLWGMIFVAILMVLVIRYLTR
jgi:hypothetical protein